MKVAITGAKGMLGTTLMNTLEGHELFALDREDCDVTKPSLVCSVFEKIKPDVVIHCAAMTSVDLCESKQFEAWKTNAFGTTNVAHACYKTGAKLIAISTDYVFDGELDRPYNEYDEPNGGLNAYAKSKWAAEQAVRSLCPNHLVARVAWLYGEDGPSFVHTMVRLADGTRSEIKVVKDQIGNPTSTKAVADALRSILNHPELVGTVHLTCEGEASWFEFAKKIFELKGINQKVVPCTSDQYPTPAKRPHNSRLQKLVLKESGIYQMPHWEDALNDFLSSMDKN